MLPDPRVFNKQYDYNNFGDITTRRAGLIDNNERAAQRPGRGREAVVYIRAWASSWSPVRLGEVYAAYTSMRCNHFDFIYGRHNSRRT